MYKHILCIAGIVLTLISCSSDKDETQTETEVQSTAIIGTWDATELKIDNETASDDAKFGKQILDFLTAENCFIITLQFNEDLTASASNSANYIEVNATATGLDIPCPTDSDVNESTYTFDGETVTTIDENGDELAIGVSIEGNIMTVDASDLDIPNFSEDGQLIFIKR
ncbi:hypothetical protein SAMN05192540_1724 [Maribacter dokdonensis]|uniref:Lipocalin-like domain-containing protein n=1 Tax=Maribacter dokdonensis TaxID=320912 RepID=A0A1H4MRC5_9FLAO|nr:hypothetical protein [Maribacter dokdonensis]SEB85539.1 hypothetical protein SAMN05192540_1724 [Maribacter dokdonensis]